MNGSNIDMGCTGSLVDRDGVMVCDNRNYLVNFHSPTINTISPEWASGLVTMRKGSDAQIPFDHVLLTFGFNPAVSLTSIELDLFLCPKWNIGAPSINVAASNNSNLIFSSDADTLATDYTTSQSSCDSLSTVSIPLQGNLSYITWHILVTFEYPHEDIRWVHVGEVRFLIGSIGDHPSSRCTLNPTPGKFLQHS